MGTNYHLIPVNAPQKAPETRYQRDEFMQVDHNGDGGSNYWPNGFGVPAPNLTAGEPPFDVSGQAVRHPFAHPNDDFVQAGNLYRNVMTDPDRKNLIGNIVDHLGKAQKRIQLRQTTILYKADPDYGNRIAEGLGLDRVEIEMLAKMSPEERAKATAK